MNPNQIEVKIFNADLVVKLGLFNFLRSEDSLKDDKISILPEKNSELSLYLPYQTAGALAFDLFAVIENPIVLHTWDPPIRIPTGIAIQAWNEDQEFGLLVFIRSSLSSLGIGLSNFVGIIDSDYQGEILCSIINRNFSDTPYTISPGERIAQALFIPKIQGVKARVVNEEFSRPSYRDSNGFGTTGKF